MSDEVVDDEEEPSILEYARFWGLTTNYHSIDPLRLIAELPELSQAQENETDDHASPQSSFRISERFTINKTALCLLSDILSLGAKTDELDASLLPNLHAVRDWKLELPLLRTNHEDDMRQFRIRLHPDLSNEHLPLEKTDTENDEGLSWAATDEDLPSMMTRRLEAEKPVFTRDTLLYLQENLKAVHLTEAKAQLEGLIVHRKVGRPVTIEQPLY